MLRFGATVEADTTSIGNRRLAIGNWQAWYILHDRQEAFELGGHGHGYVVAERRDLVAHALQRITVPATVDNKATSDGIASGFVADKFYVHNTKGIV